ncbi:hypothetical protein [Thermoflexus hugenholtzii]
MRERRDGWVLLGIWVYLFLVWALDRLREGVRAWGATTFRFEPMLWAWVGLNLAFAGLTLLLFWGALRAAPLQARTAWIIWILGLMLVGLTTPLGFQSLAGLPEPLRGWLRGLRVDAYLGQAAAFLLGIGVLSLWQSMRYRS